MKIRERGLGMRRTGSRGVEDGAGDEEDGAGDEEDGV
jgi:hypothetical protein